MKRLLLIIAGVAGLLGADLNGKWNFIWQTPGGLAAARSTLSFKQNAENVEAHFPDGKEPVRGTFKDGKLSLNGRSVLVRGRLKRPTFIWTALYPAKS